MCRASFLYAFEQYKAWLFNPRILLIIYTVVFLNDSLTVKMLEICEETGYTLNLAEPLALILSKSVNAVIIPIVFLALSTDFPRNSDNLFSIYRMSRKGLVIGEIIFSVMSALTYVILLFLGTFLYCAGSCSAGNEWSEYTAVLFSEYPEIYRRNTSLFLTSATYMQGTPYEVIFHSTALMFLYTLFLSLVIMLFKQLRKKEFGVVIGIMLTLCGLATDSGASPIMWVFPITHTVYGWHFDIFMREQHFSLFGSYSYFAVLILAMLVTNLALSKKVNLP